MEKIEIEKSLAEGYFNLGIKKPLQIFLEIKVTEKHLWKRCKETLAQVFSGKFYEIFIDRFFLEHLWGIASENST